MVLFPLLILILTHMWKEFLAISSGVSTIDILNSIICLFIPKLGPSPSLSLRLRWIYFHHQYDDDYDDNDEYDNDDEEEAEEDQYWTYYIAVVPKGLKLYH